MLHKPVVPDDPDVDVDLRLRPTTQDMTIIVNDSTMQVEEGRHIFQRMLQVLTESQESLTGTHVDTETPVRDFKVGVTAILSLLEANIASRSDTLSDFIDDDKLGKIKGEARKMQGEVRKMNHESGAREYSNALLKDLFRLIAAWEHNGILGPYAVPWVLETSTEVPNNRHRDVPKEMMSSKLVELEEQLRIRHDTVKGIIFVETKEDAQLLVERLKETFPALHPEKTVGQTPNGMTLSAQSEVIEKFRHTECKLIVSTTVLEEGFDVPECNVVFRMSKMSVIQLVQSRGRARAEGGRLIVILSRSELDRVKLLRTEEQLLDKALQAECEKINQAHVPDRLSTADGTPSETDDELFARMSELDLLEAQTVRQGESQSGPIRSVAMKMFLIPKLDDDQNLKNNILTALLETGLVQESKQDDTIEGLKIDIRPERQANRDLGASSAVFSDNACTVILSLPSASKQFFKRFISVWAFEFNGASEISMALPPPSKTVQPDDDESTPDTLASFDDVISVSAGYFTAHSCFLAASPISDCRTAVSGELSYRCFEVESGRQWKLKAARHTSPSDSTSDDAGRDVLEEVLTVEGSVTTLGACAYVTACSLSKNVVLYLPLTSTPTVHYRTEDKWQWQKACVPGPSACPSASSSMSMEEDGDDATRLVAGNHLVRFAGKPVLAIEFSLERSWDKLSHLLSDPHHLGIPTLVTRVIASRANSIEYFPGLPSSSLEQSILDVPDAASDKMLTDALIAFARLQSNSYFLPFNPISMGTIFNDVKKALELYKGGDASHLLASTRAMHDLYSIVHGVYPFTDVAALYTDQVKSNLSVERPLSEADDDTEYHWISRAVATPSRIIWKPDALLKSSRLTRRFAEKHRLVYIMFRGEECQQLYDDEVFSRRFEVLLEDGIHGSLHGLSLRFLVCSDSQGRDQNAVFVVANSQEKVEEMRKEIIPGGVEAFDKMPFKYMSRLGLYCTADTPVHDLGREEYVSVEDCQTDAHNPKLLTDGAGLVSAALLSKLIERSPTVVPPGCCAVQIRYGGIKGVLSMDPAESDCSNETDVDVKIRPSMVKFDNSSQHSELCVVRAAVYHPLKLNRDMLNLLFSLGGEGKCGGDWQPYQYIYNMQEEELTKLARMLTDNQFARDELMRCSSLHHLKALLDVDVNIDFVGEIHFKHLLQQLYDHKVRNLRSKTHIPVTEGALLMGIPDPLGVLEDGQIFFQIQKRGEEKMPPIIADSVLLYRNPLLHPGDMQVVEAVYHESLAEYVNVVIFPAKDRFTKRSIPADCSGGDLDGDMFACIWDPSLLPPLERVVMPFDYDSLEHGKGNSQGGLSLAQSVSLAMRNSCLGKIARMHMALSDQLMLGARDDLAKQVAIQQALAVDFPKTGIAPQVPKLAKDLVKEKGYPDFMEAKGKVSYVSDKPLGRLYQRCRSISYELAMGSMYTCVGDGVEKEDCYITLGHEAYLEEASETFKLYRDGIDTLMVRFGLETEAEVILGLTSKLPDDLMSDRMATDRALLHAWEKLKKQLRQRFFNSGHSSNEIEVRDRASAWYVISEAVR